MYKCQKLIIKISVILSFIILVFACPSNNTTSNDDDDIIVQSSSNNSLSSISNNSSNSSSSSESSSSTNSSSSSSLTALNIEMLTVPEITDFEMGYENVATPVHTVPLISSFKLGTYEVTYEQWYTVLIWAQSNGYYFQNSGREGNDGADGEAPTSAKNEPVTKIHWRDCIVWCNAVSEYEGLDPVYYANAGFTLLIKDSRDSNAADCDNSFPNWSNNGYRLPTEAEWEAAARYQDGTSWTPGNYASGATTFYNDVSDDNINGILDGKEANDLVAVYGYYYNGSTWITTGVTKTAEVGSKAANQLGFYDMTGNVWEFCWDWLDTYTTSSPYTDSNPKGPSTGTYKVWRGGAYDECDNFFGHGGEGLQISDHEDYDWPTTAEKNRGFRLASSI